LTLAARQIGLVAAVVFTNVLPVGTRRVMEAWYEVEKRLYDGIKKHKSADKL
jgi:hypothetical protein